MIGALPVFLMFSRWAGGWQEPVIHPLMIIRDSSASSTAFAAVAPLPATLTPRELDELQIGLEMLPQGSLEYPPGTIRRLLQGNQIHCKLLPDAVSISFTVASGEEQSGESLLLSLLKGPTFRDEAIAEAIDRISHRQPSLRERALNPHPLGLKMVSRDEIVDAFHKVFNLSSLTVGAFSPKELPKALDQWTKAAADWPSAPEDRLAEQPPAGQYPQGSLRAASGQLVGAPIPAASPDLPATILALYALGSGKVSSLFRISRQAHAWSYDQEALLWPSAAGWEPRLYIVMAANPDNPKRLDQLLGELKADVATWNPDTLAAAQGMAEANLLRQVPYGPVTFDGEPLSSDPEQRIAFDLYWSMKTGSSFSSRDLLDKLKGVDLETLKSRALAILGSSKVQYTTEGA